MAEVVESVILETDHADHEDVDIVSILLNMYFKRCKYIHTNCLLSYVQVYQLIHVSSIIILFLKNFWKLRENCSPCFRFYLHWEKMFTYSRILKKTFQKLVNSDSDLWPAKLTRKKNIPSLKYHSTKLIENINRLNKYSFIYFIHCSQCPFEQSYQ